MMRVPIPSAMQFELDHEADAPIFRSIYTIGDDGHITFFKDPNTLSINWAPPYPGANPSGIWLIVTLLLIPILLNRLHLPNDVQTALFIPVIIVMLLLLYIHSIQLALASCHRARATANYKYVRHLLITLYDSQQLLLKVAESNAVIMAVHDAVNVLRKT